MDNVAEVADLGTHSVDTHSVASAVDELGFEDDLVEEISIDGMCGVY